ncbi:hypothetical protein HS088_TW04G00955 [Tripterygium wilfordii]|uniref:Aquaporin NIP2-1-like n=1 Tax=Tripterygium wilfordii TaxID=458696 RepID=A0A7J7DS70_TRIWF|nr:aquaporin NIP2-1-like [Tripterygium wilfordii]KAF5748994.1 hypothetical protein HS088_TW04G00955 [Tripterygium wilfordii]
MDPSHSTTAKEELVSVENPKSQNPKLSLQIWRSFEEQYPPGFLKKVIAEIIATYLLVFVTCGSAALSASDEHKVSKLGASVAGGLIVTVMIYAVGHISGAHMNPAVTLAFACVKQFPWKQVPCYAAAQFTGAISAGFTLQVLLKPIKHLGTTAPSGTDIQALIMEIVVTFSMMFVNSSMATDAKAVGELAGIVVGCAVCITSIIAGPISGGSMNPARSIGPALASAYYKGIWVYVVGPVTGTLLGALSYNLIRDANEPLQTTSPGSVSFKIHRRKCHNEHIDDKGSCDLLRNQLVV